MLPAKDSGSPAKLNHGTNRFYGEDDPILRFPGHVVVRLPVPLEQPLPRVGAKRLASVRHASILRGRRSSSKTHRPDLVTFFGSMPVQGMESTLSTRGVRRRITKYSFPLCCLLLLMLCLITFAQRHDRLVAPIDGRRLVTVRGSRNPHIDALQDEGALDPGTPIKGLSFRFSPSAEQAAALDQLLEDQQDPSSPSYHIWLTPEEYGDKFGISPNDLARVSDWLQTQGFQIDYTARSRTSITFSATAGQVHHTFQTELHHFHVGSRAHFANVAEAQIPADLAPLVSAISGMDDIGNAPDTRPKPRVTLGDGRHALGPADLATIYNVKPLLDKGFDGSGQKIVVVGQSSIQLSDVQAYQTRFNLPKNVPKIIRVPGQADPGNDPDFYDEGISDVQIAGGIAPGASIIYVYSWSSVLAAAYAIDQNLAPVISYSYLSCEKRFRSAADAAAVRAIGQQAVAQGISWVASSGDNGAAGCEAQAVDHYGVSGSWSTYPADFPEVTGIGGTMFAEDKENYWGDGTGGTALSYIPETTWNETSAGRGILASSGGTSRYFAKPAWQTVPGVPNDNARHVPDISFTAASFHDPYLIISDGVSYSWGGTSAGTPFFAGVLAILNQYVVSNGIQPKPGLGNINPRLYQMSETTSGVFHDITTGDNIVPCTIGTPDCTTGQYGYKAGPGYDMATGLGSLDVYNFVQNWASAPSAPGVASTTTSVSANPATLSTTASTVLTATVKAISGKVSPNGPVYFGLGEKALGNANLSGSGGTATASLTVKGSQLAGGANKITAFYGGASSFLSSTGTVTVSVTASSSGGASNVVASVEPSPVVRQAPDADGYEWYYTIRLKETGGVNTKITGLFIDDDDYSASLPAFFNTTTLFANGTLTASLRGKDLDVPSEYDFAFSGVDPDGRKWTRHLTVSFVGEQGTAAMALSSSPSTVVKKAKGDPHCSADYPLYQQLNLEELNGYGVRLTKFVAGGNDFSDGIATWFGSDQLGPRGNLTADFCWRLDSLPTTLDYEVDGIDAGGHSIQTTLQVKFTNDPLDQKSGGLLGGADGSRQVSLRERVSTFSGKQKPRRLIISPQPAK